MAGTLTRDEANEILSQGYPTDEELKRFPLSDLLLQIPDVDPRYGKQKDEKPGHIHRTLEGINVLLSDHPENICAKFTDKNYIEVRDLFLNTFQKIFHGVNENAYCRFDFNSVMKPFMRLLAFYHDIGKSIVIERHSFVGWHLLNDVYHKETLQQLYPLILGINQADWELNLKTYSNDIDKIATIEDRRLIKIFTSVIKYHESFGVLSTGEASLPIMLDLADSGDIDINDAKELFSILMIMNLADVYGSIPEVLPQKIKIFCDDWAKLCSFCSGNHTKIERDLFLKALIKESQKRDITIDRIWRLMYEGAPPDWRKHIKIGEIQKIFDDVVIDKTTFTDNFALFCKLDYCLAFKFQLMNAAIKLTTDNINTPTRAAIKVMLNVLVDIVRMYGTLCQTDDKHWRRIGVEMTGLTRKPTMHRVEEERKRSRIAETITDLLMRPDGLGKEWAISECTVWLMKD